MAKKILQILALLASGFFIIGTFWALLVNQGTRNQAHIAIPVLLYCLLTFFAVLAVMRSSMPKWLRYPGVLANVAGVAFPILIWAKWLTGNLPLSGPAGLIPCLGFSVLCAALIWILETHKIFRPSIIFTIIVGVVTFANFAISFIGKKQRNWGQDYAEQLTWLDQMAGIAGAFYIITFILWIVYLVSGVIKAKRN